MTGTPRMPAPASPADIGDAEDAADLCRIIEEAMEALIETIERETELVRAGKLVEAGELQAKKAGLSDVYVKAILHARDQSGDLKRHAPETVDRLHRRHEEFRALLRINMAVLSTARDVSEGLVKAVSKTVGVGEKPSTYGSSGVTSQDKAAPVAGIAYDRVG